MKPLSSKNEIVCFQDQKILHFVNLYHIYTSWIHFRYRELFPNRTNLFSNGIYNELWLIRLILFKKIGITYLRLHKYTEKNIEHVICSSIAFWKVSESLQIHKKVYSSGLLLVCNRRIFDSHPRPVLLPYGNCMTVLTLTVRYMYIPTQKKKISCLCFK